MLLSLSWAGLSEEFGGKGALGEFLLFFLGMSFGFIGLTFEGFHLAQVIELVDSIRTILLQGSL